MNLFVNTCLGPGVFLALVEFGLVNPNGMGGPSYAGPLKMAA